MSAMALAQLADQRVRRPTFDCLDVVFPVIENRAMNARFLGQRRYAFPVLHPFQRHQLNRSPC
jgi:hypothetical protein